MPIEGFVASVMYFNIQMERLVQSNLIGRDRVAALRSMVESIPK
jgi:hypothetical protein